jgi:lipid-binding SYLF domain-containing protein
LRQDLDDNAAIYGKKLENRAIVMQKRRVPAAAAKLVNLLNKYSAREEKSGSGQ